MNAYLIDPEKRTITAVAYDGNYQSIYQLIDAQTFDAVRINVANDAVYIDDEGLFREPQHFFALKGYPQPLAGKGLVLGADAEGETEEPRITLEALRALVTFPEVRFKGFAEPQPPQEVDDPVFGKVMQIDTGRPVFERKDLK